MDTTKIICTVIYAIMIAATLAMVGNVGQYIDMPSAIIVVVVGVLFALAAKGDGSFIQKFGDGAVRAGWIGSIIGIICFLDAKWNDLVAGTRLAFGYNLDALCSFLAPFDMGQL